MAARSAVVRIAGADSAEIRERQPGPEGGEVGTHSATDFLGITKAALTGVLNSSPAATAP